MNISSHIILRFRFVATVAGLLLGGAFTSTSRAAITIDLYPVGNEVIAAALGSADLTALSFVATGSQGGDGIVANNGILLIGTPPRDIYTGINGPATFGPGGGFLATSAGGNGLGIDMALSAIAVPVGYVSGNPLSGTATFDNQTLQSLGVTEGTYVYTWGTGAHADSLTINVTSIPEPTTLGLIGLGGLVVIWWKKQRFVKARRLPPARFAASPG